jgi:N-acyl-D-aspartate/D-glutamate deacylase
VNVAINGTQVLNNFDIWATMSQRYKMIAKSFKAIADSQGRVVIAFTSVKDYAKVSAIEIAAG